MEGKIRSKWGKFTDNDLQVIAGKRDQLVGKLQERYGIAKDRAEKEVSAENYFFEYPSVPCQPCFEMSKITPSGSLNLRSKLPARSSPKSKKNLPPAASIFC